MAFELLHEMESEDPILPGLELSHDLHIALHAWSAWSDVETKLIVLGGRVHALSMRNQDNVFRVRCRVKGVSATQARQLIGQLTETGLAQCASVEHLMLSPSQSGF